MEDFIILAENLEEMDNSKEVLNYNIFANIRLSTEQDECSDLSKIILPKISFLSKKGLIKKDLILLSLLASQNDLILKNYLKFERQSCKHNIDELYHYCINNKDHWMLNIIRNLDIDLLKQKNCLLSTINNIILLYCIDLTTNNFSTGKIITALASYNQVQENDEFLLMLMSKLQHSCDIIEFCKSIDPMIEEEKVFNTLQNHKLLNTLSIFIDLGKPTNWALIACKLAECSKIGNESERNTQTETFEIFTVFATILSIEYIYRKQPKMLKNILDDLNDRLISLTNNLDILEDIFSISFSFEKETKNEIYRFQNRETLISSILYVLKGVVDVLKVREPFKENVRFEKLMAYVENASWRFELLCRLKENMDLTISDTLPLLLSPPLSLLALCLGQGNFIQAHRVVEHFKLEKTDLDKELQFAEKHRKLRKRLKKLCKIPNKSTSSLPRLLKEEFDDVMGTSCNDNCFGYYRFRNEIIMNFICTHTFEREMVNLLLQLARDNSSRTTISEKFSEVYGRILSLHKICLSVTESSVCDIIFSHRFPLNISYFRRQVKFDETMIPLSNQFTTQRSRKFEGVLNKNHPAHEIYEQIDLICINSVEECSNGSNYLKKLFSYLNALFKTFNVCNLINTPGIIPEGKDSSYFEILNYNRSELLGHILFENNLDPADLEEDFSKLKLDFLYHLAGNCFPTINLQINEVESESNFFPENKLYIPSQNIINYIMKRNLLLSLILSEMYNITEDAVNTSQSRILAFINYRNLNSIKNLTCIFHNNEVRTSLQEIIPIYKIKSFMDKINLKYTFASQVSCSEIDQQLNIDDVKYFFNVMHSIPEIQMQRDQEMRDLKDFATYKMIIFQPEYCRFISCIFDHEKKLNILLQNFMCWPSSVSLDLVEAELTNFQKAKKSREQLKVCKQKVLLYEDLLKILHLNTWSKCQEAISTNMQDPFRILIDNHEISKIVLFIEEYMPSDQILEIIDEECFINALKKGGHLQDTIRLLNKLPIEQSLSICRKLLERITNLEHLGCLYEFIADNSDHSNLQQVTLSLKLLSALSNGEREKLAILINDPLNIIEVLLMNSKFDKLAAVLYPLKGDNMSEYTANFLERVDDLLRSYAEKSLDFRFITQPYLYFPKNSESKLLESLDSSSSEKKSFFIPSQVPSKEEWVRDNEVIECMCCQNTTFSIFNRRHHCRRCGRLVCYICSAKRMKVSLYGHILVRVCIDCYKHTEGECVSCDISEKMSVRSVVDYNWFLTPDNECNKNLREEFTYDQAPSVSLCLSILKHHSHGNNHPIFLLDQCEKMLKVLHSSQENIQETDYVIMIEMIKSLAIAAKVVSVEKSFHQFIIVADRFLNQTEYLRLFFERGCLNSLPTLSNSEIPNIDIFVLRRLRDNQLENEEWSLALEISTKAGLDTKSVFAAWGKSCLKAGCLTNAREKFHRCFSGRERRYTGNTREDIVNLEEDYLDSSSRTMSNSSNQSYEQKPLKNSPLLNEIINILESKSAVIDKHIVDEIMSRTSLSNKTLNRSYTFIQKDPAVSILNKLRNLDHIALGKYYFPADRNAQLSYATNRPMVDTLFYNECIFYLSRYGSHQSLLEFYLKHGELDQALQYIIDNNMSVEIFIEIYLNCLKEGVVNILQANMVKIDPSLDLWENYLRQLCRYLEHQNLLHSLYQLQIFMEDYLRAAMTCIRFYHENTHNFNDLARKNNYLHKAEEHINQIGEQEKWTELSTVSVSSPFVPLENYEKPFSSSLVLKTNNRNVTNYLNIIWRQNEVASFLADCEAAGMEPMHTLSYIIAEENDNNYDKNVPTLFGTYMDQVRLAILIIVTSIEIKIGFKIVSRLIENFKLRPSIVFSQSGKYLAKSKKYEAIEELIQCIKVNGCDDETTPKICDEMLSVVIATLVSDGCPVLKIKDFIKLITDPATKVSAYIEAKQLKTAYIYAVRYKRLSDIRRIAREAELNNEPNIKSLCTKILFQSEMPSTSQ